MTRTVSRTILTVLAVAALAGVGAAQGRGGGRGQAADVEWKGKGRISGKVVDAAGQPIPTAVVLMRLPDMATGPNVRVSKKGEFEVRDMKGGEWTIRVQADGYAMQQITAVVPEKGSGEKLVVTLDVDRSAEQLKELQGVLAKGDELFKAGEYAAARAEYEKVLVARPDVLALHRSIAFTYGREGNHAKALEHMDIAIQDDPTNTELLRLATASALELKDPDRALGYTRKIDVTTLSDPDLLDDIAIMMLNKQYNPQAISVLDTAVDRFGASPMPYFLRGMAKLRVQNGEAAKADLEKFLELAPPDSPQVQSAKEALDRIK